MYYFFLLLFLIRPRQPCDTSLMGCGCHVSNDQVNNGVGVQNCQRIKT